MEWKKGCRSSAVCSLANKSDDHRSFSKSGISSCCGCFRADSISAHSEFSTTDSRTHICIQCRKEHLCCSHPTHFARQSVLLVHNRKKTDKPVLISLNPDTEEERLPIPNSFMVARSLHGCFAFDSLLIKDRLILFLLTSTGLFLLS